MENFAEAGKGLRVPGWFSAILILGVLGFALYVSIPSNVHSRIPGNEMSAMGSLKRLVTTEALWQQNDMDGNGKQDCWAIDVAGLGRAPGHPEPIPRELAAADRCPDRTAGAVPSSPAPCRGYFFEALINDENGKPYAAEADKDGKTRMNVKKFGFRATPEKYGETGFMTYQVNEEGVIYAKDLGHGAEANPPRASWEGGADPTKSGWRVEE